MLASIYSLSNPISALSRLLVTHKPWIDLEKLTPKGHKIETLEFLVEQATDRQDEKTLWQ